MYNLLTLAFMFFQPSDPFTDSLNVYRAAQGLSAVVYSAEASKYAAYNSYLQSIQGLGHHYTGGLPQCAGYCSNIQDALQMWLGSPAHAAILLAPNATSIGYSLIGNWATVSTTNGFILEAQAPVQAQAPVPVKVTPQILPQPQYQQSRLQQHRYHHCFRFRRHCLKGY